MTEIISATSISNGVSGFLVNHFGGSPSLASPPMALPSTTRFTVTKRCGDVFMLAMPYLNGKRVCMGSTWKWKDSMVKVMVKEGEKGKVCRNARIVIVLDHGVSI